MKNSNNKITSKILNISKTFRASWSTESIGDLGKKLHEEPLTEEERIIERLKYTQKELDAMYEQSLSDILSEEMSAAISKEIDADLLEQLRKSYGKTGTGTR